MAEPQRAFVSVKFDAVGRAHRFLLPEIDFEPPLRAGEQVVVTRGAHRTSGTVTLSVPQLAARRACGWRIRKNSIYRSIFMSREPEPSAKFSRWRA